MDNKEFVKKSQAIFKENGIPMKIRQLYEFYSKLAGFPNWNIASAKGIRFSDLFSE